MQESSSSSLASGSGARGSPRTPDEGLHPGRVVDRYVLIRKLGEGGMGVVFEAFDPELARKVAIKFFHTPVDPEGVGPAQRELARQRLLNEARTMAIIDHPNVVTVYVVGIADERVFVAMELIRGQNLERWLHSSPRDWRSVLAVMLAAGEGLAAVHAGGLVHRDFKPENVLVGDDGRVYVLDFGLAGREFEAGPSGGGDAPEPATGSITRDSASTRASGGRVAGTPSYMSPEQHAGEPTDAHSDQFSFCVTLYEALYGRRPFVASTSAQLAERKRGGPPEPPADAAVPRHIYDVLARGLAPIPADRFPELSDLIERLAFDRSAARRRSARRLSLAFVAVVSASLLAWRATESDSRCTQSEAAARTREIWNPRTKAAMVSGMQNTGLDYATQTATRIAGQLERRLANWREQFVALCAPEMSRIASRTGFDVKMDCLDRRLAGTSRLVEVLTAAKEGTVDAASGLLFSLAPISDCSNEGHLTSLEPEPDDPGVRTRVRALRREFDELGLMSKAGKRDLERAHERVLERAYAIGFVPAIGEAHLISHAYYSERGRADTALDHARAAIMTAEASGHDRLAAQALGGALFVEVYLRRNAAAARELMRHAETHVARLAHVPEVEAEYLARLGPALAGLGEEAEAELVMGRAADLHLELFGPEHPSTALVVQNHGVSLAVLGRLSAAAMRLEQAIRLDTQRLGPSSPQLRRSLSNLSIMTLASGSIVAAVDRARRGVEIHRQSGLPADVPAMVVHRQYATALTTAGRANDALEVWRDLHDLEVQAYGAQSDRLRESWVDLALAYLDLGRIDEATLVAQRLDRLVGGTLEGGAPPESIVFAQRVLTLIAHARGRHDEFEARRAMLASVRGPPIPSRDLGTAMLQLLAARIELAASRPREALMIADRVRAELERAVHGENASCWVIDRWRAEAQLALGQAEAARATVDRALDLVSGELRSDNPGLTALYVIGARAARALGDERGTKNYVQRAERSCDGRPHALAKLDGLAASCGGVRADAAP